MSDVEVWDPRAMDEDDPRDAELAALRAERDQLQNRLNADSQTFQIACLKETERVLRERVAELEAELAKPRWVRVGGPLISDVPNYRSACLNGGALSQSPVPSAEASHADDV